MKHIALNGGRAATVDDADYDRLNRHRWYYERGVAVRAPSRRHPDRRIFLHREIVGATPHQVVYHVNGDSLDNRRANLRIRTVGVRNHRQPLRRSNTSGYRGVSYFKLTRGWRAEISKDGRTYALGYFQTTREAAAAYNKAAQRLYGPDAFQNDVEGMPLPDRVLRRISALPSWGAKIAAGSTGEPPAADASD